MPSVVQMQQGKARASSSGIVIGNVQKLDAKRRILPEYNIMHADILREQQRLLDAISEATCLMDEEMRQIAHHPNAQELVPILQAHRLMLNDSAIVETSKQLIHLKKINAEWALKRCISKIEQSFEAMTDPYLRSRQADVGHVAQRIFGQLMGEEAVRHHASAIMVATDFSGSDVVEMWRSGVVGFVSMQGGEDSHAMILARSIGITGLSGTQGLYEQIEDGDVLIIDAERNEWILNPSTTVRASYDARQKKLLNQEQSLKAYIHAESCSNDGYRMPLMANLEFSEEVGVAVAMGAEGVGLFRTEFLFMQDKNLPTEEQQFEHYAQVLKGMAGKPVVFRLLDIGADKLVQSEELKGLCDGLNPALGLRGVRLLLHKPLILEAQLRAITRALAFGQASVLIPMVSDVSEVQAVRQMLDKVARDFGVETPIPLGVMIEVPAAVFIADELAKEADFFSIGSNDLVQYSLAVDRADEHVGYLYNSAHPAVSGLIRMAAEAAHRHAIPISICGELAANPAWTQFFLDIRMTSLSMVTRGILPIRKHLSQLNQAAN